LLCHFFWEGNGIRNAQSSRPLSPFTSDTTASAENSPEKRSHKTDHIGLQFGILFYGMKKCGLPSGAAEGPLFLLFLFFRPLPA
jgi:hypothetical protein